MQNIRQFLGSINGGFTVVNVNNNCLYIDGIISIMQINSVCIRLFLVNKQVLEIAGKNLKVDMCSKDSIVINGSVNKYEILQ